MRKLVGWQKKISKIKGEIVETINYLVIGSDMSSSLFNIFIIHLASSK
jgi:hypothetical protein